MMLVDIDITYCGPMLFELNCFISVKVVLISLFGYPMFPEISKVVPEIYEKFKKWTGLRSIL